MNSQEEPLSVDRRRIHHQASHAVSNFTTFLGSFTAICVAVSLVAVWAIGLFFVPGGPFNSHYEMVITSMTTMITFVMVFIIQSTQNRESRAMQTKLDALLIAKHGLDEAGLLGLEDKPDATIKDVQSEVHETERRTSEERNRSVISANMGSDRPNISRKTNRHWRFVNCIAENWGGKDAQDAGWVGHPGCSGPRRDSPIWPLTRLIVGSVPVGVTEAPRMQGDRCLELPFSFVEAA
jgi:low affinity Fe/Cu permease